MTFYDDPEMEWREETSGYPEQHLVYRDGQEVAYVRLRFGSLTCSVPHGGARVYEHVFEGEPMKGSFEDEAERRVHAILINAAIRQELGMPPLLADGYVEALEEALTALTHPYTPMTKPSLAYLGCMHGSIAAGGDGKSICRLDAGAAVHAVPAWLAERTRT